MADDDRVRRVIEQSGELKPDGLIMSPKKWKFLLWCMLTGENMMLTGPSGFGKTLAANCGAEALGRTLYEFNMGSTQDPRTVLLGTREAEDGTTTFIPSRFIEAVQDEGAVILLDEVSRADPEAWNILMTALDPASDQGPGDKRRYIRLDESQGREKVVIADNVSFVATANIGVEYTSTRRMDRALKDRFSIVEVDIPTKKQEYDMLTDRFPDVGRGRVKVLCQVFEELRDAHTSNGGELSEIVSTRSAVECCKMMRHGFSVQDALEFRVYTLFDGDGGEDSPRGLVRETAESLLPDDIPADPREEDDGLPFGSKYFS